MWTLNPAYALAVFPQLAIILIRLRSSTQLSGIDRVRLGLASLVVAGELIFPFMDGSVPALGRFAELFLFVFGIVQSLMIAIPLRKNADSRSLATTLMLWVAVVALSPVLIWDSLTAVTTAFSIKSSRPPIANLRSAELRVVDRNLKQLMRKKGYLKVDAILRDPKLLDELRALINGDTGPPWVRMNTGLGATMGIEATTTDGRVEEIAFSSNLMIRDLSFKTSTAAREDAYCSVFGLGPCGTESRDLYGYCDAYIRCVVLDDPEH